MGFLTFFVKNGEIRPSLCYKRILEHKRREINSILDRDNSYSVLAHFENKSATT